MDITSHPEMNWMYVVETSIVAIPKTVRENNGASHLPYFFPYEIENIEANIHTMELMAMKDDKYVKLVNAKIKKIMDETAREIYPAFLWNMEIRIETANGIRK